MAQKLLFFLKTARRLRQRFSRGAGELRFRVRFRACGLYGFYGGGFIGVMGAYRVYEGLWGLGGFEFRF